MKLKKKSIIIYAVAVAALIVGIIFWKGTVFPSKVKAEKAVATDVVKKIAVKVKQAETTKTSSVLSFKATLEAGEEGLASSKASGKVVRILFENGKQVSQGEPLVQLDDQSIKDSMASAEAQLRVAQTGMKAAENQLATSQTMVEKLQTVLAKVQSDYDRTKALFEQGTASKAAMENAEAALKTAEADLKSAKNGVETSRLAIETSKANIQLVQVSVDTLRHHLEDTVITAPMNGILDEKSVILGQYVGPGTAVAKIKDSSSIHAVIDVVQSDLKYIKAGQKARVKLEENDARIYEGIVKSVNASADSSARSFTCKVELDNKDASLKPGTYAVVEISSDQEREVLTVPINVLMGTAGDYSVFVNENGAARKRSVTLGEMTKDMAEIKSGINIGDSIICSNVNMLQDGDAITVIAE